LEYALAWADIEASERLAAGIVKNASSDVKRDSAVRELKSLIHDV
jgi:hypothetical protein